MPVYSAAWLARKTPRTRNSKHLSSRATLPSSPRLARTRRAQATGRWPARARPARSLLLIRVSLVAALRTLDARRPGLARRLERALPMDAMLALLGSLALQGP